MQHQGTLEQIERAYILETLEACDWQIRGPGQVAERLGLHPSTLYSRMKKLCIERHAGRGGSKLLAKRTRP